MKVEVETEPEIGDLVFNIVVDGDAVYLGDDRVEFWDAEQEIHKRYLSSHAGFARVFGTDTTRYWHVATVYAAARNEIGPTASLATESLIIGTRLKEEEVVGAQWLAIVAEKNPFQFQVRP